MEVVIVSHQENMSLEGAIGTKHGRRKRLLQGSVPMYKPNTSNPSPQGALTHPISFIEGDATGMVNMNQFTSSHSVTGETARRLCCLGGQHHHQCKLYQRNSNSQIKRSWEPQEHKTHDT